MRKLLLKLANKIYKKYAFNEIKEDGKYIFKGDIYVARKITFEQKPMCLDVLRVEFHKVGNLTDYINNQRKGV